MFQQRKLVIATKHGKESVIAPLVEEALGVQCIVLESFDSDQFGTFSGEVQRNQDALETVRMKCYAAMDAAGCDLAVASEGSFGPHPIYFFAQADDEIVLFVDRKLGIEIWARELSTQTNFNGKEVRSSEELLDFVQASGFPSHAVILRESSSGADCIIKGINTEERLREAFNELMQRFGAAYVETDMRAMHNPMRMKVIEQATKKLVNKILSVCPSCAWPGFDVTDRKSGLPCSDCGMPTQSTLCHIYSCASCGFSREHVYPKGKETEEPRYCDYCNP
jgi:hypothetical protein